MTSRNESKRQALDAVEQLAVKLKALEFRGSSGPNPKRDYIQRVVWALQEFLMTAPIPHEATTAAVSALKELIYGLQDLDDHGTTADILKPSKKPRRSGTKLRERRGMVRAAVHFLRQNEISDTDDAACGYIAQRISKRDVSKKTVLSDWKKRADGGEFTEPLLIKQPANDQEFRLLVKALRDLYTLHVS